MPLAHDVRLSPDQTALFPERCVVCGAPVRSEATRIRSEPHGLCGLLRWFGRAAGHVLVPAHSACGVGLSHQLRHRNLLNAGLATLAVVAGVALGMQWELSRGLSVGLVVLLLGGLLGPVVTYQVLRPAPFAFTDKGGEHLFEFEDPDYAHEFAALNDAEVE
jgi:hypothetical protein